jgi:hypothetical protein
MTKSSSFDWAFWFQWMVATAAGWVIGTLLFPGLATVTIGVALGVLQWFLLKSWIREAWWWIVATAFGWALGSLIFLLFFPEEMVVAAGLVFGLTTGLAQWIVISRFVRWSGWWVIASVVAWTTGIALFPGIVLPGVIAGLISATAIAWLFTFPKVPEAAP